MRSLTLPLLLLANLLDNAACGNVTSGGPTPSHSAGGVGSFILQGLASSAAIQSTSDGSSHESRPRDTITITTINNITHEVNTVSTAVAGQIASTKDGEDHARNVTRIVETVSTAAAEQIASTKHGQDHATATSSTTNWTSSESLTTKVTKIAAVYNATRTTNSTASTTTDQIASTGEGIEYARSCQTALYDWFTSSSNYGSAHLVTSITVAGTYDNAFFNIQPPVSATEIITLCDGNPRAVGSASYINTTLPFDGYVTVNATDFGPYPTPEPCTIDHSDCVELWQSFYATLRTETAHKFTTSPPPCVTDPSQTVQWGVAEYCGGEYAGVRGTQVQLLYWPVRTVDGMDYFCNNTAWVQPPLPRTIPGTRTGDGPNTFVTEGLTITSPTIALSYSGLSRDDGCGPTIDHTIITLRPEELYSVRGARALYDHYNFNLADLNWMCQTPDNSSSYTVQDVGGPHCYQNVPLQAYWSAAQQFGSAEYVNQTALKTWTILNNYQPYVVPAATVWQEQMMSIFGSSVYWDIDGAWDPPIALRQATAAYTIPSPAAPIALSSASSADSITRPSHVSAVPTRSSQAVIVGTSAAPIQLSETLPSATGGLYGGGSIHSTAVQQSNPGYSAHSNSPHESSSSGSAPDVPKQGSNAGAYPYSPKQSSDAEPSQDQNAGGSSDSTNESSNSGSSADSPKQASNAGVSPDPTKTSTVGSGNLVFGTGSTAHTVPVAWIVPPTLASGNEHVLLKVGGKDLVVGGPAVTTDGQVISAVLNGFVVSSGTSQTTVSIPTEGTQAGEAAHPHSGGMVVLVSVEPSSTVSTGASSADGYNGDTNGLSSSFETKTGAMPSGSAVSSSSSGGAQGAEQGTVHSDAALSASVGLATLAVAMLLGLVSTL